MANKNKNPSENDLMAYVDGFLSKDQMAQIEMWLENHPNERKRIEKIKSQNRMAKEAFAKILPTNSTKVIQSKQTHFTPLKIAASLIIVTFIGLLLAQINQSTINGTPALAREAMGTYATYADAGKYSVEFSKSQSTELTQIATQRLGYKFHIPDLSNKKLSLLGGRIVSTPHGAAVMAMYNDAAGQEIIIISRPMKIDKNKRMKTRTNESLNSVTWSRNGIGYSVVGKINPSELYQIAETARDFFYKQI